MSDVKMPGAVVGSAFGSVVGSGVGSSVGLSADSKLCGAASESADAEVLAPAPLAPAPSTETDETCKTKLINQLMASIQYRFKSIDALMQALTHKSRANELNAGPTHNSDNERLEFLGDAVLDLAMTDCLMRGFPNDTEGSLSKKRASLVNEESLAQLATGLKLDRLILLGKGELKTGGLQKPRILASALEAILGAIFNEAGFPAALASIEALFAQKLEDLRSSVVDFKSDFKTRLQETAQLMHKATPTYQVNGEKGPDHDKLFEVSVVLDGRVLAKGLGKSKKSAEQDAARVALETEYAANEAGSAVAAGEMIEMPVMLPVE